MTADVLDLLLPRSEDLPYVLSFGFASIASIALAWAMWIKRTLAREAELLQIVRERTQQLEEANRRLEALSYTDALTGVSNRRGFDQAIDLEWRRAIRSKQPLSLLLLDVDHFKAFNDSYGHQQGDDCLAAVGAAMAGIPRRAGDRIARYGGEEFVALLPATDEAGAAAIAERMRRAVEGLAIPHRGSAFGTVTASLGYATIQAADTSTPATLIAAADAALYEAKRAGRNGAAAATVTAAISDPR